MSEAAHILIHADQIEPQAVREIETRVRELILRGHRVIVVELPDWGGLDASVAGMLLRAQRSVSWRNGRLIVVAPEQARRTLDFMGLTDAFELIGTHRG
jgi:hypothetical protein